MQEDLWFWLCSRNPPLLSLITPGLFAANHHISVYHLVFLHMYAYISLLPSPSVHIHLLSLPPTLSGSKHRFYPIWKILESPVVLSSYTSCGKTLQEATLSAFFPPDRRGCCLSCFLNEHIISLSSFSFQWNIIFTLHALLLSSSTLLRSKWLNFGAWSFVFKCQAWNTAAQKRNR